MTEQNMHWPFSRAQAITEMIASIANEQTALGRIMDAEAKKMERIMGFQCVSPEELLAANQSVNRLINAVARLEMILQSKLELFEDCICADVPAPVC